MCIYEMYMILKYLLPSKADEKVLESAEMLKLDNGGWWCWDNRRDGKRSPSGRGDTASWSGHIAFGACAGCPVRRASEHTAGKRGYGAQERGQCYKRIGNSYIYKAVKATALKQVFQGKYIEHEISIRWEHRKWVHSLIYLLNSFHRVNQWTEAALHSVFHGTLLHGNRKPPPKNHPNNAFSLRRVWETLLPQDLSESLIH